MTEKPPVCAHCGARCETLNPPWQDICLVCFRVGEWPHACKVKSPDGKTCQLTYGHGDKHMHVDFVAMTAETWDWTLKELYEEGKAWEDDNG